MELNTFFHYGAASVFKSSKGAVKKSLGTAALNKKKKKKGFYFELILYFATFLPKSS